MKAFQEDSGCVDFNYTPFVLIWGGVGGEFFREGIIGFSTISAYFGEVSIHTSSTPRGPVAAVFSADVSFRIKA